MTWNNKISIVCCHAGDIAVAATGSATAAFHRTFTFVFMNFSKAKRVCRERCTRRAYKKARHEISTAGRWREKDREEEKWRERRKADPSKIRRKKCKKSHIQVKSTGAR